MTRASSWADVLRGLNYHSSGGLSAKQKRDIRTRSAWLGVDLSHLPDHNHAGQSAHRRNKLQAISAEKLALSIVRSSSWAELYRNVGYTSRFRPMVFKHHVQQACKRLNINFNWVVKIFEVKATETQSSAVNTSTSRPEAQGLPTISDLPPEEQADVYRKYRIEWNIPSDKEIDVSDEYFASYYWIWCSENGYRKY